MQNLKTKSHTLPGLYFNRRQSPNSPIYPNRELRRDSGTAVPSPGSERRARSTAVWDSIHWETGHRGRICNSVSYKQLACNAIQACNSTSYLISSLIIAMLTVYIYYSQVILTKTWKAVIILILQITKLSLKEV